jgi:hypothetical protein
MQQRKTGQIRCLAKPGFCRQHRWRADRKQLDPHQQIRLAAHGRLVGKRHLHVRSLVAHVAEQPRRRYLQPHIRIQRLKPANTVSQPKRGKARRAHHLQLARHGHALVARRILQNGKRPARLQRVVAPTNGKLLPAPVRFAQRKACISLKPAQDMTDRRSREAHFISHRLSGSQPFKCLQRLHRLDRGKSFHDAATA